MSNYQPAEQPQDTEESQDTEDPGSVLTPRQGRIWFAVAAVFLTGLYLFFALSVEKPEPETPTPYMPPDVPSSRQTPSTGTLPSPGSTASPVPIQATATSLTYATLSPSPGMGFGGKPVPPYVAKILKDRQMYSDATGSAAVASTVVQLLVKRDWRITPGYVIRQLDPLVVPEIYTDLVSQIANQDWESCYKTKCQQYAEAGIAKRTKQANGYLFKVRARLYINNIYKETQYWDVVVTQRYRGIWVAAEVSRVS